MPNCVRGEYGIIIKIANNAVLFSICVAEKHVTQKWGQKLTTFDVITLITEHTVLNVEIYKKALLLQ